MLPLRSAILAVPLVTLACSASGTSSAPDSGSGVHDGGGSTADAANAGDAADAAPETAADADAGAQDGCAVYFAALSSAQTLGATCFGEGGTSPLDAGNQPSLCEMELGSTACTPADRASFLGDASTLASCVSSLGACDAPNESTWSTSESACRAAFGSGLSVSSACSQALYIAGF